MDSESRTLDWSAQFTVALQHGAAQLPGDKILLPPSALERLLEAAPVVTSDQPTSRFRETSTFDPYNPYSFAAERHARAQSTYEQQQLPHPLTFRLVNSSNNRVVYAGIREFSAHEGTAGLSPFLLKALGIDSLPEIEHTDGERYAAASVTERSGSGPESPSGPRITVHAKQLPKGTYVKLRPLEAGYDPQDWKSLLEEYMRRNFTTLSRGEILTVPARGVGSQSGDFQFLIDEFAPKGDGICVVDTDLEVDIEALNEEQARETMKKIADKVRRAPGTRDGSSTGGELEFLKEQTGQVLSGEYVDYELPSWNRSQSLDIEVSADYDENELLLFASPFSARQRVKPRLDEHVFHDLESRGPKRIRLSPTNVELENAETLWISVHAPAAEAATPAPPRQFRIRAAPSQQEEAATRSMEVDATFDPNEVQCKNCQRMVPKQSLVLHENFCLRNNILCPNGCGGVFQKGSDQLQNHWHCPYDSSFGNTTAGHHDHDRIFHTTYSCPNCHFVAPTLPLLAQHRTSTCPGKLILCQFCHLEVPQEGDLDGTPNPEALLSGLTPHELADGARTTECHLCGRIVRLRDMATHLKNHEHERLNRSIPRMCRNVNCGRTLDGASKTGDTRAGTRMGQGAGNDISLCSTCFGPLYVNTYDPDGKMLKRRVERRYLSQLLTGCGKTWCRNEFCKVGRKNVGINGSSAALTTKDALPMVQPFVNGLAGGETPLHFCVDEGSQRRRRTAEMMAAEKVRGPGEKEYDMEWCVAALEAESGDLGRAREWLSNFAPSKAESRSTV